MLVFLGLGAANLCDSIVLHESGRTVDARVTNYRVRQTRFGTSYELQYLFKATLSAPSVGRTGYLGDSLWSELPKEKWDHAVAAGFVSVLYELNRPNNNAPLDGMPRYLDNCVPILFGGLFMMFGMIGLRRQWKAKNANG